jgi:hypothetical protein
MTALSYRNGGGTVTSKDVMFTNGPFKDAGAAAWDVTINISGSNIEVQVTGEALHDIEWKINGFITENG